MPLACSTMSSSIAHCTMHKAQCTMHNAQSSCKCSRHPESGFLLLPNVASMYNCCYSLQLQVLVLLSAPAQYPASTQSAPPASCNICRLLLNFYAAADARYCCTRLIFTLFLSSKLFLSLHLHPRRELEFVVLAPHNIITKAPDRAKNMLVWNMRQTVSHPPTPPHCSYRRDKLNQYQERSSHF